MQPTVNLQFKRIGRSKSQQIIYIFHAFELCVAKDDFNPTVSIINRLLIPDYRYRLYRLSISIINT